MKGVFNMKIILDMKCRVIICDDNVETYNVDRRFANLDELRDYIYTRFVPYVYEDKEVGDPDGKISEDTRFAIATKVYGALRRVYYDTGFAMIYPIEMLYDGDSYRTIAPCILHLNLCDAMFGVESFVREISD